MHLTDEQLNEYLDNESPERKQIESHLASCRECAARLSALQTLFAEIESLPDLELTRDLREVSIGNTARFPSIPDPAPQLPRWLTLTVSMQAVLALIVFIVSAPLIANLVPVVELPSSTEVFLQLRSQWTAWLDLFSVDLLPALPRIPALEIPSLVLALSLTGITVLWLLGNGLLLKKRMK
ncbi:MAG TPA: zf-HC2 domain-containing protein [Anaerolineales bacterium]|nr:zf-HC2 domain-containing protein [Anaerolineales bacterium]